MDDGGKVGLRMIKVPSHDELDGWILLEASSHESFGLFNSISAASIACWGYIHIEEDESVSINITF
jgi:hypothetical protein